MNAPAVPLLRLVESKRLQSPRHRRPSRLAQRAAVLMFGIPLAIVYATVLL